MKCLITGASGFIGRHLVHRLEQLGHQVIKVPHENTDYTVFIQPFDWLFHLASYGNHYNQTNEREMMLANIVYLSDILTLTKDIDYKAFINFSTSSVTLPKFTMYAATKAAGEQLVKGYVSMYQKPIVNIRPLSIYGPGEADFRFIPTVINNGLKGDKSKIIPSPRHDWLYIDDFLNAILLIVENINFLKGRIIPVGSGLSWSNKEVADTLDSIFAQYDNNYKEIFYDILLKDIREYDTTEWIGDNSIIKDLGWKQNYSLREGLVETYKYYYERFKKEGTRN